MPWYHEINWSGILSNSYVVAAILLIIPMALMGYFKLRETESRRGGGKHIGNRYNYKAIGILGGIFAVGIVAWSHVESPRGWDQLALNGLGPGDDQAWAMIVGLPMFTLIAIFGLWLGYMFVAMGFVEVKRQVLLSQMREEARKLRRQQRQERRSHSDAVVDIASFRK